MHLLSLVINLDMKSVSEHLLIVHFLDRLGSILLLLEVDVCDGVGGSPEEGDSLVGIHVGPLDSQRTHGAETTEELGQLLIVDVYRQILHEKVRAALSELLP